LRVQAMKRIRGNIAFLIVLVIEIAIGLFGTIDGVVDPSGRYLIPGSLLRMGLVVALVVCGLKWRAWAWALWGVVVIESGTAILCLAFSVAANFDSRSRAEWRGQMRVLIPLLGVFTILAVLAVVGTRARVGMRELPSDE
jgi:hypothetical protein